MSENKYNFGLNTDKFNEAMERYLHSLKRLVRSQDKAKELSQGKKKSGNVPFSEILEGQIFWWNGECYIKENEDYIFLHEPFKRPFKYNELVEISI